MMRFSANLFTVLAALAALVPAVAAAGAPNPDLIFGAQNFAFAYVATIFATVLIVFAPFAGWSVGPAMSATEASALRAKAAARFGFLASIHPYVYLIVKLLGQIAIAVVYSGYILHEYADEVTGTPVAITATWYVYIVILVASALRLDMFASEVFYRMHQFWLGIILALLSFLAWAATCVFLIWDIVDLPAEVSLTWEIALLIVSIVWLGVSFFFALQYIFMTWAKDDTVADDTEGLMTSSNQRKYR
jgi:hypothetical protein